MRPLQKTLAALVSEWFWPRFPWSLRARESPHSRRRRSPA
jgi:hypothetical protein